MEFVFFRTNEKGCALWKNLKVALVLQRASYCNIRNFVGPAIMVHVRYNKIALLNFFRQGFTLCFGEGVRAVKFDRSASLPSQFSLEITKSEPVPSGLPDQANMSILLRASAAEAARLAEFSARLKSCPAGAPARQSAGERAGCPPTSSQIFTPCVSRSSRLPTTNVIAATIIG